MRTLKLQSKLLTLGVILSLAPLLVVGGVVYWQNAHMQAVVIDQSSQLANEDLQHIVEGIYQMCATQQEVIQWSIHNALNLAHTMIAGAGGITFNSEQQVLWQAVNQYTNATQAVKLPAMQLGATWLGQNKLMAVKTPFVDEVMALANTSCTIFQRMNSSGDMLRVATTVPQEDGTRAIGTYIPAVNPDNTPNPVVASVLRGEIFRGRAFVVDRWYITNYKPLTDQAGEVVGVLSIAIPQEQAKGLRKSIINTKIGKTGYIFVLNATGFTRGHYVISKDGEQDGADFWDVQDANGNYVVREICQKALESTSGKVVQHSYSWLDPGASDPREKKVALIYFPEWDWVIGASAYMEEFKQSEYRIRALMEQGNRLQMLIGAATLLITLLAWFLVTGSITRPLIRLTTAAEAVAAGKLGVQTEISSRDEIGALGKVFNHMSTNIARASEANDQQIWLKNGITELNERMLGEKDLHSVSESIIAFVSEYLGAEAGAIFLTRSGALELYGAYAWQPDEEAQKHYHFGEGLIGEVARRQEMRRLKDAPAQYLAVRSALGASQASHLLVAPLLFEQRTTGVIEIGGFSAFTELQEEFLKAATESSAIAIEAVQARQAAHEAQQVAQTRVNYLQGLNAPVMTIDTDFNVTFMNEASLKLLGKKSEEVIGQKCHGLWKTGDCCTKRCASANAMRDDRVCVSRTRALPDQLDLPIQYAGSALKDEAGEVVGAVELIIDVTELTETLERAQQLSEELEQQSEELRVSNEELEQQSEELRASNEELEEKSEALEQRTREVEKRRAELELAKINLENQARELEQASRYKSEFLANMSHELRTPLNSLLILAKMLADNEEGNLSSEQVESARIIYSGGQDLLFLINEILDLSKVEAGMMELHYEVVTTEGLAGNIQQQFTRSAENKGLFFNIEIDPDFPQSFTTDPQRLEQILRNFLSNAFKFTSKGGITLRIHRPNESTSLRASHLTPANTIAFAVQDTGLGIPGEKQAAIFEAFQQADGSTSRQYGGTGLGLSISRALAELLKGEITLESREGEGSCFTLYLPLERRQPSLEDRKPPVQKTAEKPKPQRRAIAPQEDQRPSRKAAPFLADDRTSIKEGERSVLIIEDDPQFARILMTQAQKKGFKCIAAGDGASGLTLAGQYRPSAIILDLGLPDIDGAAVLDGLKYDLDTRHIPVHVMSARDKSAEIMHKGAIGYLTKPLEAAHIDAAFARIEDLLDDHLRTVLIVEDDENSRKAIEALIGGEQVAITGAASGAEAARCIRETPYDCVILDLGLPDMSGFELLHKLDEDPAVLMPPIIVYTGRELTAEEVRELNQYTTKIVVKGVSSPERLLDETSLFLHTVASALPKEHEDMLRMLHDPEQILKDRAILLVDDDLRNSFALSKILKKAGLQVVLAENGAVALERLDEESAIELVLMDIMMPVMDGYETMRRIRKDQRFTQLPIVALTAKAMVEDRAKCIEAGANDYLAKPIDTDKLLSLMRVLLYR